MPPDPPTPLASSVVDTHCHLDVHDESMHGDVHPDPDELLALAASVGVTRVVQIGCDVDSAKWAVEMAQTRPNVVAGVALHPNAAARIGAVGGREALQAAWDEIARLAADPVVRAVGETGLDYFRTDESGHSFQQESFRWHIRLARALDRTLVIHDRDAHADVIAVLEDEPEPGRVVFHCFSGDAQMAAHCAARGWYVSFAGVVTFKNAQGLREALRQVPDHLVLVETDAPYLAPVPNRGRANASYLMPLTVRAMAVERDVTEEAMCATLWENAQRAFGEW